MAYNFLAKFRWLTVPVYPKLRDFPESETFRANIKIALGKPEELVTLKLTDKTYATILYKECIANGTFPNRNYECTHFKVKIKQDGAKLLII